MRTMRLVLLPSRSISNYEKFTASDKLFLIPSAIKADTPEPLRLVDLPRTCVGEFKSSVFVRSRRPNFFELQLLFFFPPAFDVISASVVLTRDDVAFPSRLHATRMISNVISVFCPIEMIDRALK